MKQYGRLARVTWVGLTMTWSIACSDMHDEDGSDTDPLALTDLDASLDAGAQVTYAQVYALLQTNCVSCHGAGKSLDLSSPELARAELVGIAAEYKACAGDGGVPAPSRVVAGDPETSLLMSKLSTTPICGKPMPPTGPLSEADVAVFRAWIASGAAP